MEPASVVAAVRTVDLDELQKHTTEKDCYMLYNGKVYDVTEFLDEHPGGYDIILNVTGKDATEDYDEIGHSNSAREMLEKYLIGDFEGSAVRIKAVSAVSTELASSSSGTLMTIIKALLPVLVVLVAAFLAFGRN